MVCSAATAAACSAGAAVAVAEASQLLLPFGQRLGGFGVGLAVGATGAGACLQALGHRREAITLVSRAAERIASSLPGIG